MITIEKVQYDFAFDGKDAFGHVVNMDTSPETGGHNYGVRPMQMLLMGLGGCSGIDVMSILKKQQQVVKSFTMKIDGTRQKDVIPSLWEKVHISFEFTGQIDPAKAHRACSLSIEKYCSVAETLRKSGTEITWTSSVTGE